MKKIFFENAFNYKEFLEKSNNKANISTLLYHNPNRMLRIDGIYFPLFDLENFFKNCNLVDYYELPNGKYKILLQPEIKELRDFFEYKYFHDIVDNKEEAIKTESVLKKQISEIASKITKFIYLRDQCLSFKDIGEISIYSMNENLEIQKVFALVSKTIRTKIVNINDYFQNQKEILLGEKAITFKEFYSYKDFRKFLKEYCQSEQEYYSDSLVLEQIKIEKENLKNSYLSSTNIQEKANLALKMKTLDKEIEQINQTFNDINASPLFNKEILTMLCLNLETLIKKENIIDRFVELIKNNKTSTIEIDNNQIFIKRTV